MRRDHVGYPEQNAKFIGRLLDDLPLRESGEVAVWTIPWHRLRDQNGHCRSPRVPGQVVMSNSDKGNVRWTDEGGRLTKVGGQASQAQRFDIDLAIRKCLLTIHG